MASQITSVSIDYSTICSGPDQRKHLSLALLAFVRGIHRSPVNSPHKGPVTRKMFPFDDAIMKKSLLSGWTTAAPHYESLDETGRYLWHVVDSNSIFCKNVLRFLCFCVAHMVCFKAYSTVYVEYTVECAPEQCCNTVHSHLQRYFFNVPYFAIDIPEVIFVCYLHLFCSSGGTMLTWCGTRPTTAMFQVYALRGRKYGGPISPCTMSEYTNEGTMMTSSNGNIFRATGPLWGNSPVISEFSSQRPVTRSFDIFFDLRLNKRLSKQSKRRWFETPSHPLWRHCNDYIEITACVLYVLIPSLL